MRVFNPLIMAALQSGRVADFSMISMNLPSGVYGYFSGKGQLLDPSTGVTYLGYGSVLDVGNFVAGTDGSARSFDITLSSIDNPELGANNILWKFYDEDYNQAQVNVSTGYYDVDTMQFIDSEIEFLGRIDNAPISETAGGDATLQIRVESRERDFTRQDNRRRNATDHLRIDSREKGLDHAIATKDQIGKRIFGARPGD